MERQIHLDPRKTVVIKINPGKGIVYANDYALEVFNYDLIEFIGKKPKIVCHDDMPDAIYDMIGEMIFEYQKGYAILKHKTQYNRYFWAFTYFAPSYKENGSFDSFITLRKPIPVSLLKKSLSETVTEIENLYFKVRQIEKHSGAEQGRKYLEGFLEDRNFDNLTEYYLGFFKFSNILPDVFKLNHLTPPKTFKKFYGVKI